MSPNMLIPADPSHLLIPYASLYLQPEAAAMDWSRLQLPNLAWLLARLQAGPADVGSEESLSPPHERALAQAMGLPPAGDGLIPWAALQAAQLGGADATPGQGWALITPCHWQLATSHVAMEDPEQLQLSEDESRALLAAMQPYFAEDGLALYYLAPGTWLAQGEVFRDLPTAALDRVAARRVDDWLPRSAGARALRRLQNEMQMLLYTHAVNDARTQQRQRPVNSFWISGSGALASSVAPTAMPTVPRALASAARSGHTGTWMDAWQQLDASACAALRERMLTGAAVRLTLCGERSAQSYHSGAIGLRQKIKNIFSPPSISSALEQL
ncbi:phosphoglycerate mutase [Variovorax sp. HJSM1_2]|uniref:phosphoglycerate mutase n=1 Tax=Variovorax sp. HJSM1_2 TaxID=3366263 RepID=UPI003BD02C5E